MLWNPRRKEPNWGRQVSALLEVLDQKFQKKNKEIVINNFSLIPPGIWKDMRPGSFQVFNLFLLNYILSFNDTLSYLTSKRAIPDLQKDCKRLSFKTQRRTSCCFYFSQQAQPRHWGCFGPTRNIWANINASEPHIFPLPSINFCLPFQKTSI